MGTVFTRSSIFTYIIAQFYGIQQVLTGLASAFLAQGNIRPHNKKFQSLWFILTSALLIVYSISRLIFMKYYNYTNLVRLTFIVRWVNRCVTVTSPVTWIDRRTTYSGAGKLPRFGPNRKVPKCCTERPFAMSTIWARRYAVRMRERRTQEFCNVAKYTPHIDRYHYCYSHLCKIH